MEEARRDRQRYASYNAFLCLAQHLSRAANEGAQKRHSSDESDDDSGVEVDSPSRKKHKASKVAKKKDKKVDWTKNPGAIM